MFHCRTYDLRLNEYFECRTYDLLMSSLNGFFTILIVSLVHVQVSYICSTTWIMLIQQSGLFLD